MNAIPAKVAGVERLVMTVPTPDGVLNPLVLAAARMVGIDEIYRVGGAQAVAALAYGTATIAPVDKIVGPGNAYVAAAKRRVFGRVGIDMIAGPSEILVVADRHNDPAWIAADLLSQAEHDAAAQAILITDDAGFRRRGRGGGRAPSRTAAAGRRSRAPAGRRNGAILIVADWDEAPALIDRIAPEHLELALDEADALAERVHHAGAIFLGRHTPEAIGDYIAGPEPRAADRAQRALRLGARRARFPEAHARSSAATPASLAALAPAAIRLAEAEGLDAHALSLSLRLDRARAGEPTNMGEHDAAADRRHHARRAHRRPPQPRDRARARRGDLRPARRRTISRRLPAAPGRYHLHLAIEENRLIIEIRSTANGSSETIVLPLAPFRGIVKDYFLVCESYYEAIRGSSLAQIEAIDVGRRSLHDEGSALLIERLAGKVAIDHDTARRLFTLICVLHLRG